MLNKEFQIIAFPLNHSHLPPPVMENKIEKFLPIDQKDRDLVLPLLLLEKADKPSPGFFSASVDQKKSKKQKNQDKRAKNRLNVCGILFFPFLYFIFFPSLPKSYLLYR